jgi:hypothetical protein
MNRSRASCLVVSLVAALSCEQPGADSVNFTTSITFPDLQGNGTAPLDAVDGFPFRVQVCTAAPTASPLVVGSLQAHVWLPAQVGGAMVPSGTVTTDTATVTLEPQADGGTSCAYSAITTLNAPGPGPVQVEADIDGAQSATACAFIGPPYMGGAGVTSCTAPNESPPALIVLSGAVALPLWNGSSPRYTICAETAAAKGTVTIASYDPSVVSATQTVLTGTLIPGPCSCPSSILNGPGVSHVNFDIAISPPTVAPAPPVALSVTATLTGMPSIQTPVEDPYVWTTPPQTIGANTPLITLRSTFTPATPVTALATGQAFEVTVKATQLLDLPAGCMADAGAGGVDAGSVTFATNVTGVTFSPAANITDGDGNTTAAVVVPYGT